MSSAPNLGDRLNRLYALAGSDNLHEAKAAREAAAHLERRIAQGDQARRMFPLGTSVRHRTRRELCVGTVVSLSDDGTVAVVNFFLEGHYRVPVQYLELSPF